MGNRRLRSTHHDIANHLQILSSLLAEEPPDAPEPGRDGRPNIARFGDLILATGAAYRCATPLAPPASGALVRASLLFAELSRLLPELGRMEVPPEVGRAAVGVDVAVRLAVAMILLTRAYDDWRLQVAAPADELVVRFLSRDARSAALDDAIELAAAVLGPAKGQVQPVASGGMALHVAFREALGLEPREAVTEGAHGHS